MGCSRAFTLPKSPPAANFYAGSERSTTFVLRCPAGRRRTTGTAVTAGPVSTDGDTARSTLTYRWTFPGVPAPWTYEAPAQLVREAGTWKTRATGLGGGTWSFSSTAKVVTLVRPGGSTRPSCAVVSRTERRCAGQRTVRTRSLVGMWPCGTF